MSVGEQRVEQRVEQHVEQPVIQPATETAVKIVELGSIPNFDCAGDATSLGTRWNKCIRSFKFFLAAKGIINRKQNYHYNILHTSNCAKKQAGYQTYYLIDVFWNIFCI